MQFGFIHTDHLSSPISNLLLGHCRRRQQSTTSIFNLRSHIWGGWLGARIYNLHSPSPISTFWPCCCSERSAIHNLNLRSLVLNGEPDWRDLLARLGRVRVRDPLGSPVLIYYLYPNDLLVLRRDFHYSISSSRGASRLPPVVAAGSRCFKKLDILTFLPPSETGDSHTPVSDQGECIPPPLAPCLRRIACPDSGDT